MSGRVQPSPVTYDVAQFVEVPRYKSEGRGFDSRWRHSPPLRTMALRST